MNEQPRPQFLISLTKFLEKACPDEDAYRIFEVLLEQEYPITLEELAEHVIGEGSLDDDEDLVLEHDEEQHDNARRTSRMREGIVELQCLSIPILKTEDGRYRLGKSTVDIIEMMTAVEKEIDDLNGTLNSMHMNFGRQLEAYHDYDEES